MKKTNRSSVKLNLSRETLRRLDPSELARAAGGTYSQGIACVDTVENCYSQAPFCASRKDCTYSKKCTM